MQHVVSYAAMGVSSARLIKGQRHAIDLVGALIGGAVGCAICFLNYVQGQVFEPIGRDMPKINPYIYVWNVSINLPDL
ncbi:MULTISPECIES: hypothetical protein [Acinetobacter]|uniref:hypothetical protein n=1 Tax=Acinetobacter TaxID=469 RepID=UPI00141A9175|nr:MULTISPECIES: hypothetical protein [Acinetobacter]MCS4297707.1 hypothetical protein [Acinetobacter guillouiae]MCW2251311.1 hypothetical protein [Acinetobacter sp. BIGb0204]NII36191.1 hypothetical protein [Acinetobacter sp. BIGb0196]